MKKLTNITIRAICLILLFPVFCHAQSHLKKANRFYDNLSFAAAVPEYEKALRSDPNNLEALTRIAHCFRLINDTREAEKWYSKVVQLQEAKPAHLLFYTQALMSNGNYPEAETWIKKYAQVAGNDEKSERILESLHELNTLLEDSANYLVEKLSVNSPNSDCSPVIYKDGIVFSSSRKTNDLVQSKHEWTGLPFFNLYYAKGKENKFEKPEEFAPSITTKFNNGSLCFNNTFNELYVTRNNTEEDKKHRKDTSIIKLKIYHFKKSGSKWVNGNSFPYNSDDYNCAHPYMNVDGSKLFFASDMPGGYGGLDLYVCIRNGDSWGKPMNLGPAVNTFSNDGFPFVDEKEGLFFASDGRGGLGGFDIFYSPKSSGGYFGSINLGYPINSSGADLGWVQNQDGSSGYFSSNRESKNENDDIYIFSRMAILLNVLVYDSKTKLPMVASNVKIIESGREKKTVTTSEDGTINILLTPGKKYHIVSEKERYLSDSIEIETTSMAAGSSKSMTIVMEKRVNATTLDGKILASDKNKTGMADAQVRLVDIESGQERFAMTSKDGSYKFENVPVDGHFRLDASKENFVSIPVEITAEDLANNKMLNTDLVLSAENDIVKMDNIYYDLDKYYIRADAAIVLDDIVNMMKSNPAMKIELRSHTDCRQTKTYNMILSEKRANAAMEYMVMRGISNDRLTAKGYGETMPVINCNCDGSGSASCGAQEFQQNRRTEFKIVSLK